MHSINSYWFNAPRGRNSDRQRTHIMVQAYVFIEACNFYGFFRRNFVENDPHKHNLKMVQKDASRNSTQSVTKISS